MDIFKALGETIEGHWRTRNYDELAFPEIAAEHLERACLPEKMGAYDVVRWLAASDALPKQSDLAGQFGDLPLTVYHGRRFEIQVLHWLTRSTTIHGHGFSGAFQLLHGTSLHSRYVFEQRERISAHLLVGHVRLENAEVLHVGQVRRIDDDLLHAVYHLDAPSMTIVVRTYGDRGARPQYEYLPPSLAISTFFEESIVKRWLQGLAFLIRMEHAEYETLAAEILGRTDIHSSFAILQQAHRKVSDQALFQRLAQVAKERHGAIVDDMVHALLGQRFREAFTSLRDKVRDPEQRFFLALLQNLPHRQAIFDLLAQHDPARDARTNTIRLAHALSGVDRIGVDFDDALNRLLFEALLDGCSAHAMLERLAREFEADEVHRQWSAILDQAERMRQTLLAPLFQDEP